MRRPKQQVITDSKAAALLLDELERRYLSYFFGAPRTVSYVAAQLEQARPKVLYRVRKLHEHGLLRITRREARAGRPIKHYQTSAERFIVPYAASAIADAQEFLGLIEGSLRDAFYESFLPEAEAQGTGVAFSGAAQEGITNLQLVTRKADGWRDPGPSRSATNLLQVNLLALPEAEAACLKRDLLALLRRYQAREVEGAPLFLLRSGLVKLRGDAG